MVVTSNTTTDGGKELKENWPITEGLILGTTKLAKEYILKPEGLEYKGDLRKSTVEDKDREML